MGTFILASGYSLRRMQDIFNIMCAAIFIFLTLLIATVNADEVTCVKDSNCRCTLSDNSYYYDLEPMVKGVDPPFFKLNETSDVTYYYDPCRSFSMTSTLSECTDAALCSETLNENYLNLGIHNTSEFVYSPDDTIPLKVLFHNGQSGAAMINSTVWLTCNTDGISYLVYKSSAPTYYLFELFSPFACAQPVRVPSSGLTGGAVLCIVFVVLVAVYFGGGFIYLFFFKYESGRNAIPHNEFWCSLPGLIKDGFLFMCSCICGDSNRMKSSGPEYDQI